MAEVVATWTPTDVVGLTPAAMMSSVDVCRRAPPTVTTWMTRHAVDHVTTAAVATVTTDRDDAPAAVMVASVTGDDAQAATTTTPNDCADVEMPAVANAIESAAFAPAVATLTPTTSGCGVVSPAAVVTGWANAAVALAAVVSVVVEASASTERRPCGLAWL